MRDRRAIVFDLDDTLYPYGAFVRSGFRAVACRLASDRRLPPSRVLRVLRRAATGGRRGQELQALCEQFDLPTSVINSLAELIREHAPTLRLPRESAEALARLRPRWKVGVLTNGDPRIQRRKVEALGVEALVDSVLFATEYGDGQGKPGAAAFHAALDRLKVEADRAVFVGDDLRADIEGAGAVGMKTIHVIAASDHEGRCSPSCQGIHVRGLRLVPAVAEQLVPMRVESHVA